MFYFIYIKANIVNALRKLSKLSVCIDALNFKDINCANPTHIEYIDALYNKIIGVLRSCASEQINYKPYNNTFNKPGWNDYVSDLHKTEICTKYGEIQINQNTEMYLICTKIPKQKMNMYSDI